MKVSRRIVLEDIIHRCRCIKILVMTAFVAIADLSFFPTHQSIWRIVLSFQVFSVFCRVVDKILNAIIFDFT